MNKELKTLHTDITRMHLKYNAPIGYLIKHRESNKIAGEINFQKGAVQDGGLNGIFIEDLLLICIDQLEHFQNSDFACQENEDALRHLRDALASTRARQYERSLRGVQGKNLK